MSLTDGNAMPFTMNVAPASAPYYGGGNGGFGGFGGDWGWIILLLLCAGGNGFGFGGFGGGYGGMYEFPWLLTGQQNINNNTNDGFRDSMLNTSVTSVRDGISSLATQICGGVGDIQNSLCNGFAGVNATVSNGFAQAEIAENARQMANMQQLFNLSTQFANCCCENRLGIANLGADIARENCADRQAVSDGVRDIIANQTQGIQAILTQMCNDKIDAKNDEIAQLRQEVLFARGQASQVAQNATIIDGIYNRLDSCPVGTTPVYGRTPIFTCNQNNGCGCGCIG